MPGTHDSRPNYMSDFRATILLGLSALRAPTVEPGTSQLQMVRRVFAAQLFQAHHSTVLAVTRNALVKSQKGAGVLQMLHLCTSCLETQPINGHGRRSSRLFCMRTLRMRVVATARKICAKSVEALCCLAQLSNARLDVHKEKVRARAMVSRMMILDKSVPSTKTC